MCDAAPSTGVVGFQRPQILPVIGSVCLDVMKQLLGLSGYSHSDHVNVAWQFNVKYAPRVASFRIADRYVLNVPASAREETPFEEWRV